MLNMNQQEVVDQVKAARIAELEAKKEALRKQALADEFHRRLDLMWDSVKGAWLSGYMSDEAYIEYKGIIRSLCANNNIRVVDPMLRASGAGGERV